MDVLAAHWNASWKRLGSSAPAGLLEALLAAYREPQRHYHTLQHLEECLRLADEYAEQAEHPAEPELALWFHDAVYEVRAHDNEERSAQWAVSSLREAGLAAEACERIHALIMATRHNALPATLDAALLTDIDLAILGAPPARFAEYERQIRAEYAWVPPEVYADKRRSVLLAFFQREHIYATPSLRARFEAPARANLQRATTS
ncbi:N-methyl-D-aspartate receptor NMDAR2C subunit [Massilia sp. KIM]|uniref:HD domain-containing protein n=1 Tax=Massilia sp. KIM TaxID=1955422 RepID=UPI00098E927C|nr:N-methyl-D-aspartate receptor NMDAR2C subunit [Massilia sp. KIM]OON60797.1 N-methyl-D-aspartate receptor NMDAR2C subunit [Massilia sp. KIM]